MRERYSPPAPSSDELADFQAGIREKRAERRRAGDALFDDEDRDVQDWVDSTRRDRQPPPVEITVRLDKFGGFGPLSGGSEGEEDGGSGGGDKMATDPPVSEKQRRAMYAAREGRSTLGIPKKVGEEFVGKGR